MGIFIETVKERVLCDYIVTVTPYFHLERICMKLAFKAKWYAFLIMQFSIILFVDLKMALELSESISMD